MSFLFYFIFNMGHLCPCEKQAYNTIFVIMGKLHDFGKIQFRLGRPKLYLLIGYFTEAEQNNQIVKIFKWPWLIQILSKLSIWGVFLTSTEKLDVK